jgi:TorA maturation chaperone TorD
MGASEKPAPRTGADETAVGNRRDGTSDGDAGSAAESRLALAQRSLAYGLLKDLYSYPLCEESLSALGNWQLACEAKGTTGGLLTCGDGLAAIREFLAAGHPRSTLLEECDREYTRLFTGPGIELVPPYASFYTSHGRLMTDDTVRVQRLYGQWGLGPAAAGNYPADHIAFEMGFLSFLGERILAAYDAGADAERLGEEALAASRSFLALHMIVWVPRMVQRLLQATSHPLFRGLGLLTVGYLSADLEALAADE